MISILETFGAGVVRDGENVTIRKAALKAADIDLANAPDLFPIIAVLASQAKGTSRLYGAAHLRFKESDRIMSTVLFLRSMVQISARLRMDALLRDLPIFPGQMLLHLATTV